MKEFRYEINRDLYLQLLEWQLKMHDRKKSTMVRNLLGPAIFSSFSLYYAISSAFSPFSILLAGFSIVLWLMMLSKRANTSLRAKNILSRLLDKNAFDESFFSPHTLRMEGDNLSDIYGHFERSVPVSSLRKCVSYKDIIIVPVENGSFAFLPFSEEAMSFIASLSENA